MMKNKDLGDDGDRSILAISYLVMMMMMMNSMMTMSKIMVMMIVMNVVVFAMMENFIQTLYNRG